MTQMDRRVVLAALLLWSVSAVAQMGMRRLRSAPVALPPVPPDIAVTEPDPGFPLRAHLFVARWNGYGAEYHGYGTGNLTEGAETHGFDYTFSCAQPFVRSSDVAEAYQARWRKAPYQLEILMGRIGSEKEDTCTLKVVMREAATAPAELRMAASGAAPQPPGLRWQAPNVMFDGPDPDYPVRLHVLAVTQRNDMAGATGWGTANVMEKPMRGVDFTFSCDSGFLPSSTSKGFYQGHWVKPDQELEILTQRTGSDKVDKCRIKVTMHDQPYAERQPLEAPSGPPVMQQRSAPESQPTASGSAGR